MGQSIDLNNLKEEINRRKKDKGIVNEGSNDTVETAPKDGFLDGLLASLKTGKRNESTELIRMVENKAAEKNGEKVPEPTEYTQPIQPQKNNVHSTPPTDDYSRESKLYEELERKHKEFYGGYHQPQNNPQQNKQLVHGNNGSGINESKLHESVINLITENAGVIVERALKDAVFDLFTEEKIKEVISENKKMIRGIVYEIIRELQQKKKS